MGSRVSGLGTDRLEQSRSVSGFQISEIHGASCSAASTSADVIHLEPNKLNLKD